MRMNFISKIRTKMNIYASKKSSNLFDGSYKSIYQGNGLDFENLREYIPGDNIRDIDWKSSSRSGKMLVKRYVAERKHNIMIVLDTGRKMMAHTKRMEIKKELALQAGGIVGYVAARNGDNVGAIYNSGGKIRYHQLRTGTNNVERIITMYDREKCEDYDSDLEKSLDYIVKNIKRKMVVFVITDATGIRDLSEGSLKKLSFQHDLLFIRIGDSDYTGKKERHYNQAAGHYVPDFFANNRKLRRIELQTKAALDRANSDKLLQFRIASTELDNEEELMDKILDVLAEHRYVNLR